MKMARIRGLVALAVVLAAVAGLVVHAGLGTPSALGWRDIAALCPVGALEALAGAHALLVHPLVLLLAVLAAAFAVGKAFCSWACPVPHLRRFFRPGDRAGAASEGEATADDAASGVDGDPGAASAAPVSAEASGVPLAPVGGARDGRRLDSRHAVLAGAVASSFAFGFPVFCLVCPVGLTFALIIGVWNLFRFNEASWGLLIVPVVIILEVVVFRRWCTTFCPISALLSLMASRSRLLRPVVERSACLRGKGADCRVCVSVCPEQVDPHSAVIPECSRCGECVEQCPVQAITVPLVAPREAGEPSACQEDGARPAPAE